ncbi:MAG TPA: chromate efflux transporter [Methanomicrobiales archaeon]|nr:chromate efflux transporter [Methanomicrobiales archaeon]
MDESRPLKEPPSPARLFLSFLLLGATAFGGPAMVEYIRRLSVEEKGWLDERSFRDGVALCTTVPGATAMQVAAYVGLRVRGVLGAAAAYIAFGLPAFLFMMVLSALYLEMKGIGMATSAFQGLKLLVVAIVGAAALGFSRDTLTGIRPLAIALLAAALFLAGVSPIAIILLAGVLGILLGTALPAGEGGSSGEAGGPTLRVVILIILGAAALVAALALLAPPLAEIFSLMLRIDLFAFGGGQASLPLLFHEVVTARGWLDAPTFLDGIALGQVTPGPIVISATFIGYLLQGPAGGLVATIGIFLPSFLMVIGIAPYFPRIRDSPALSRAFGGIVASFAGLLISVTILFGSQIPWNLPRVLIGVGAFLALSGKVKVYWVVIAGVILSLLLL